jgi:hypothetical protein
MYVLVFEKIKWKYHHFGDDGYKILLGTITPAMCKTKQA